MRRTETHDHFKRYWFWDGTDGRRYYRPDRGNLKKSYFIFTRARDAINHRKNICIRAVLIFGEKAPRPEPDVTIPALLKDLAEREVDNVENGS